MESQEPKEGRRRGLGDALVWIIVLIILVSLVIAAVLALYQRFF